MIGLAVSVKLQLIYSYFDAYVEPHILIIITDVRYE
jgi:hypothetical protein